MCYYDDLQEYVMELETALNESKDKEIVTIHMQIKASMLQVLLSCLKKGMDTITMCEFGQEE